MASDYQLGYLPPNATPTAEDFNVLVSMILNKTTYGNYHYESAWTALDAGGVLTVTHNMKDHQGTAIRPTRVQIWWFPTGSPAATDIVQDITGLHRMEFFQLALTAAAEAAHTHSHSHSITDAGHTHPHTGTHTHANTLSAGDQTITNVAETPGATDSATTGISTGVNAQAGSSHTHTVTVNSSSNGGISIEVSSTVITVRASANWVGPNATFTGVIVNGGFVRVVAWV